MNRTIRFGIATILFFSIFLLARNQVAEANQLPSPGLAARNEDRSSLTAAPKDDCEKDKKGKDKDQCKGTVKPPPRDILIPVTGAYSIGGFCTLDIALNDPAVTVDGTILTPLPGELPDKVHKVRQGCLLTYHYADQFLDTLPPEAGSALICFAATPKKQMTIYFYNIYASDPQWAPLETTVQDGGACASANASGVYVASFIT